MLRYESFERNYDSKQSYDTLPHSSLWLSTICYVPLTNEGTINRFLQQCIKDIEVTWIFAKDFEIIVVERTKNLELNWIHDSIGIIIISKLFMKLYPMDGRWLSRKLHRAVKIFNSLSPQEIIRSDVSLSLSLLEKGNLRVVNHLIKFIQRGEVIHEARKSS